MSTRTRSAVIALALAALGLSGCASGAAGPAPASPSTDSEREASLAAKQLPADVTVSDGIKQALKLLARN